MRGRTLSTVGLLALSLAPFLGGCSDLLVLHPKGPIGEADRQAILQAFGLMLIVAVPVIAMSIFIPWRYRATNTKATYSPGWTHSNLVEVVVWLVPTLIVGALGVLVWTSTHRLDPYKPIESSVPAIEVEAVSLDWKWLFIYPRLGIATVNQLVFPAKTPLSLRITSDTVMTAFFVPQLGSQIYAMAGMETRLNLQADEPGTYLGENTQYSGDGFSYMHFDAVATTKEDFDQWVAEVRQSPDTLDQDRLEEIEKPSARVPVGHFSDVTPKLFETIIAKYMSMDSDEPMPMPMPMPMSMPMPTPTTARGAGAEGNGEVAFEFEFEDDADPRGTLPAGTDAVPTPERSHPATKHNGIQEEN